MKMSRRCLLASLFTCLFITTSHAADFSGWNHAMKISFQGYNQADTLNDFPVLVVLNETRPGFQYADFDSPTGGDLRFTDCGRTVELNYEIETWNTNGNSYVWVQVPEIVDSSSCIYAYWGRVGEVAPPYTTDVRGCRPVALAISVTSPPATSVDS